MPDAPNLLEPNLRLYGPVDDAMFHDFRRKLDDIPAPEPVVLELMTFGGDADVGRRIALEIRLAQRHSGRTFYFLGKTVVYSSGVTIMSAIPCSQRHLTRDAVLLIHSRRMDRQLQLHGSLSNNVQIAKELLAELEVGQRLEREGFIALIAGSDIAEDEIVRRAETSWYLAAEEALNRGLIAAIL